MGAMWPTTGVTFEQRGKHRIERRRLRQLQRITIVQRRRERFAVEAPVLFPRPAVKCERLDWPMRSYSPTNSAGPTSKMPSVCARAIRSGVKPLLAKSA